MLHSSNSMQFQINIKKHEFWRGNYFFFLNESLEHQAHNQIAFHKISFFFLNPKISFFLLKNCRKKSKTFFNCDLIRGKHWGEIMIQKWYFEKKFGSHPCFVLLWIFFCVVVVIVSSSTKQRVISLFRRIRMMREIRFISHS